MYALSIQMKVFSERLMPIDSRFSFLISVFLREQAIPADLMLTGFLL